MSLLLLVEIDLADAKIDLFETYEEAVLGLLPQFDAMLLTRVRTLDGQSETHLLEFPDQACFDAFRAHPDRAELQPLWDQSGAKSTVREVRAIG